MNRSKSIIFVAVVGLGTASCDIRGPEPEAPIEMAVPNVVPEWSKYVIWYQIFPERFRNGDPSNDPTAEDIVGAWPFHRFDGWQNTPWSHDWYEQEAWAKASGEGFYVTNQARRFGGDLQGILDKLDYVEDLGVTAIYLNPVNDSPSLHKYDPRMYRHVDHNLGPDPEGDLATIATEDPIDPSTWKWTSADSLLLVLVDQIHARGMRVVLDYSWNHTGSTFWAFQDAVKDPDSPYRDWYTIRREDDPATPENELEFQSWGGSATLPEIKEIGVPAGHEPRPLRAFEGDLPASFKELVFHVSKRWLDPNGDGDPSDGIDGYRLDVAGEVPLGFWRDYRTFVKGINPEAVLIGEIWWGAFPDDLLDPNPWLGPVFDAIMNYRWYPPTRSYLNGAHMFAGDNPVTSAVQNARLVAAHLDSLVSSVPPENARAMMNAAATHDTPRLSTSIYNTNPYKAGAKPEWDRSYKIDRPDSTAFARVRMLLALQFGYVGAPQIWNGDEVGMWGADDPDCRKPIVWDDLKYDDEVAGPDGLTRKRDKVAVDHALLTYYKRLIAARKAHLDVLVDGDLGWPYVDEAAGVLVMTRRLDDQLVLVALNGGSEAVDFSVGVPLDGAYENLLADGPTIESANGALTVHLEPTTSVMLARIVEAAQP